MSNPPRLDSYERVSIDLLEQLEQDSQILLLNSMLFRTLIAISKKNKLKTFKARSFEIIDMMEIVPSVLDEIRAALPFPDKKDVQSAHFVTELISQYGISWVPTTSREYQTTISTSFIHNNNMVEWQRYYRAKLSTDKVELTMLLIDPSKRVRDKAMRTLKTI